MRTHCFLLGLVLVAACSNGPRLQVDPSQAEFPFGAKIHVDGQIEGGEWANARDLHVDLPDGRRVGIKLQRDRSNFYFAFSGLDAFAGQEVHPEIHFDLWGNGGAQYDSNDWWFSIARELCWTRGGYGEGDCGHVLPGWQANVLPLSTGQVVEVSISFDAIRFAENYDGIIGLAFRFVDVNGAEVGIWPLRADVRQPSTWAPISLRH